MSSIVETYDAALKGYRPLVKSLSNYRERYDERYPELQHFFERSLNAALNQVDLTIGLKHLILAFNEKRLIEANYFARAMTVTAYDILLKSGRLMGGEVRKFALKHLPDSKHYTNAAQYVSEINQMRIDHHEYLKGIRNNVFGHKDENALTQFEIIDKLDINRINKICYDLYSKNYELLGSILYLSNEIQEYLDTK